MISVRSLVRALPRNVSRISTRIPKQQAPFRVAHIQAPWRQASARSSVAAFSTSRPRFDDGGHVNAELAAKIAEELRMEQDFRDAEKYTDEVKAYLDNSPFEIQDTPGQEEVVLTRKFGDENIRVTFSIADLNNIEESDEMQDRGMLDEDAYDDLPENTQSGGANTKGAVNQGKTAGGNIRVAPEDRIAPADRPELAEDESAVGEEADGERNQSFPARVNVTIQRPNKGSLQIETVAQDDVMIIESVHYFPDAELADPKSAEKEFVRRGLYTGPPFGNLDEGLQTLLESYLDERGVNSLMANFIPNYIDFKEQKEYLRWLQSVKAFVED